MPTVAYFVSEKGSWHLSAVEIINLLFSFRVKEFTAKGKASRQTFLGLMAIKWKPSRHQERKAVRRALRTE